MKAFIRSRTVPQLLSALISFHAKLTELSHKTSFERFVLEHPNGDVLVIQLFDGLEKCMQCLLRFVGLPIESRSAQAYFTALEALRLEASTVLSQRQPISLTRISRLQGEYAKLYRKLPRLPNIVACHVEHTNLGVAVVALWKLT